MVLETTKEQKENRESRCSGEDLSCLSFWGGLPLEIICI